VGRVYEYFLSNFALAEGKGKGEFYTPKSIVNLIAELIEPYKGKIYDPCCGSGGMFVQSMKFVENHRGNTKDISVYGQEGTTTTLKLAKMNLAIRGISAKLGEKGEDTFAKDQHPDLKADFIMANPPFNMKDWRATDELNDDPRWSGYEIPPVANANYGWILHMVSKLSENGIAGFILANGALSAQGDEKKIRKRLVELDIVEAIIVLPMDMFYTTDISVSLWILNKNKDAQEVVRGNCTVKQRNRKNNVLFIDARSFGYVHDKKYIRFDSEKDIRAIADIFHSWQQEKPTVLYRDQEELCYSSTTSEIAENDFSLVPSSYIHFKPDTWFLQQEHDVERIKKEVRSLLENDNKLNERLLAIVENGGHQYEV